MISICSATIFPALPFALRCDECALDPNGGPGNEPLHRGIIWQGVFRDDLQVPQAGTVVQLDERKILRVAACAHPALHLYRFERRSALQGLLD